MNAERRTQNAERTDDKVLFDLRLRTYELARRIIRLCCSLSRPDDVARTITRQLLRSGTSVGANYRETQRARSKAEFSAILGLCLKELDETAYWLDLLSDEGLVDPSRLASLRSEVDELISIFVTSINTSKRTVRSV